MVVCRVFIAPDHLSVGPDLVEITAMPHGPWRIEVRRFTVVAVVAQIAVRQDDRVATGAHGQLPLMSHLTVDIYEIDMSVGRLGAINV
jgi:hypothetical protein